jgi:hypothetical protein
MAGDAQMPAHDLDEERIALGRPDGGEMADGPDGEADQPEAQAEADGPGQRAVEDGDERGAPPSRIGSVSAR